MIPKIWMASNNYYMSVFQLEAKAILVLLAILRLFQVLFHLRLLYSGE